MGKKKRKLWLEIAFDILQKIHSDLCHERMLEEANELREIMRRLILFSEKV